MLNVLMKRLSRVAEAIAATALAAIFIIFLLQIFTRYSGKLSQWLPIPNLSLWMSEIEPLRWTVYLISLIWAWLIFFGCSFVVRERDHVAFDIFYQAVPPRIRKIMTVLGAIILIVVMLVSLPATWDAIMANRLMELKKLQTLRLPITGDKIAIKWLFFPYLVLMAILIIRSFLEFLWNFAQITKHRGRRDMSVELIFGLIALFGVAAIGVPVAYAIITGVVVYLGVSGQDLAIAGETMVQRLFDGFLLLAVPLFIVSANIMNIGSITDRLLQFCVALVGRFRGGLGHVNVVASLIFSGMSGSAVADAAGIGKIIIEMMVKSGHYTRGYAAAITAATATIGPIIPPSIPMVLYALVSNVSIGDYSLRVFSGSLDGSCIDVGKCLVLASKKFRAGCGRTLNELPSLTVKATPALLMPAYCWVYLQRVTTPQKPQQSPHYMRC